MIDYEIYCQIRRLVEGGLSYGQASRELNLDPETVAKYRFFKCCAKTRATPADIPL
jgi:orotate phosphoribosyltransferase-like protein